MRNILLQYDSCDQRVKVENAFARLRQFRAVATRYGKLGRNYESVVALACAFLWLPM